MKVAKSKSKRGKRIKCNIKLPKSLVRFLKQVEKWEKKSAKTTFNLGGRKDL